MYVGRYSASLKTFRKIRKKECSYDKFWWGDWSSINESLSSHFFFLRYRKLLQENHTLSSQVTGPKSHKKLKWFSANVVLLNARLTTGISEFICFVFKSLHCMLIQNFMAAIIWRLFITTSRKFHINIICHLEQGGQNFPVIFTKYFYQNKRR